MGVVEWEDAGVKQVLGRDDDEIAHPLRVAIVSSCLVHGLRLAAIMPR